MASSLLEDTDIAHPYTTDVWRTEDGLPQNTVLSIFQSGDGYLWIGPQEGLLRLLVSNRGRVVSRTQILQEILGYSDSATTRTVDTHILNLRQKIEDHPGQPCHIQTVYGEGYRLVE